MSFDLAAENDAAIVFGKELDLESLEEETRRLTGEVAATLQRRSIGIKAWEGYLLLVCKGDASAYDRAIQDVQHDLSYCRKLVVAASDIESAPHPEAAARDKVSFLFPIDFVASNAIIDVRRALVERLVAHHISRGLASELVGNFDEVSCHCADRLSGYLGSDSEGSEK